MTLPEPTVRHAYRPDDIPKDGGWYVMRTESIRWEPDNRPARDAVKNRVKNAVKYVRRVQKEKGKWAGFEVQRVKTTDKTEDLQVVTWTMLGRWT
jgi:hypothetical protein